MNSVETFLQSSLEMARLVALFLVILFSILAACNAYDFHFYNLKEEVEYDSFKRRYDICHLPVKPGNCGHAVKAWYFIPSKKGCERFTYTLCGGNANRFYTEKECMDYCNGYKYVFKLRRNDFNNNYQINN